MLADTPKFRLTSVKPEMVGDIHVGASVGKMQLNYAEFLKNWEMNAGVH